MTIPLGPDPPFTRFTQFACNIPEADFRLLSASPRLKAFLRKHEGQLTTQRRANGWVAVDVTAQTALQAAMVVGYLICMTESDEVTASIASRRAWGQGVETEDLALTRL